MIKNVFNGVMLLYYINPLKEHPERIKKIDRKIACNVNYDGIEFPIGQKKIEKVEVQNNICISVFFYENKMVFPIYVSDKRFKDYRFIAFN